MILVNTMTQWLRTTGNAPSLPSASFSLEHLLRISTISLMILGLVGIYSASSMKGLQFSDDSFVFVKKQSLAVFVCILLLLQSWRIPPQVVEKLPFITYCMVLVLLALVLVPSAYVEIGGAKRWLQIFGIRLQAAELAKLTLVLLLARNLSRPKHRMADFWHGVVPNLLLFMLYAVLLMLQPDFGTTVLLGAVCLSLLVVAGIQKRLIAGLTTTALLFGSILIAIAPYRLKRMMAFLDPWAQVRDGGFQIIQSYVGFQNGGLLGRGLGESKQKLFFLPEAHTDFILSVIGEELGFLGVAFSILCFFTLIFCAFRIARKQQDPFWYLTCLGMTFILSIQTLFNMGVVMGLLPTKGIPLPFVSNGLSSLLSSTFMVCILLIAQHRYSVKGLKNSSAASP